MTDALISKAEKHAYRQLFIHDLNWSAPDHKPITYVGEDGHALTAINVSSYRGLRVWVCDQMPGSDLEAKLDREISKTSTDRLVIFYDGVDQVWRWPVRRAKEASTTTRLTRHRHRAGVPNPGFGHRLDAIRLPLDKTLDTNAVLAKVRAAFDVEVRHETKRASQLMARMYTAMEKAYAPGHNPASVDHQISVTLARILFLMFGDDTDMWPTDLFRGFVHHQTNADGSNIGSRLSELFDYLDTPPKDREGKPEWLQGFPYVNGGIFRKRIALPVINAEFRKAVLDACVVDWSTVSPAIFGSMFQSVRDARTRRELGEHYTSEENILRTLNPLFLDELRADLQRAKIMKNEALALRRLRDRLGNIRFMDPACGCGNFLIVAYRELRDLELRIMERLQELTGDGAMLLANVGLKVKLDHFFGIEIDEWPARIAETAMFLIDRQCDLKLTERLGWAPDRLPIQEQATIHVGNALRVDWSKICPPSDNVIVAGNPPFLGHATRSEQQAQELRDSWGKDDISRLDYVTGWHAKALQYFRHHSGRWAFVTTNSIVQGDPVPHLFGPIFEAGWRIKFAHRTFPWTSDAAGRAAVHCVIVGFGRGEQVNPLLFEHSGGVEAAQKAAFINAYLVDGPNVFVVKRTAPLSPGLPVATFGNMPRDDGNLVVDLSEYEEVASDPIAAKYLRPFLGSEEVLHGKQRWCLWMTELDPRDLRRSRLLARRVEAVREFRLKSTAASTRQMSQTPHLFGQRPALHSRPYIIIPRISSELRPFYPVRRVPSSVIASDQTFTAADPNGYLFAVISSSMFITWQRTVGGRLESRLRFSNTIVWNNLPLPSIDSSLRAEVIAAGESVQTARNLQPDRTLAQHYDPTGMSPELVIAHERLDAVVDRAFGSKKPCATEADRQHVLFARYQELAAPLTVPQQRRPRLRRN